MSIPLYLVGSLLLGGLYLNKNGKQSRKIHQVRDSVHDDEKPSSKNIYHSERLYDVWNKVFTDSTDHHVKSKDPINENIIPRFYNEMATNQQNSPELNSYIEKRGSRLRYFKEQVEKKKNFINEGGNEQGIEESPMFNPLGKNEDQQTPFQQLDQQIEQFTVGNRKGGGNGTSKQEHFGMFTIHGPRNSNNPNFHNNMVPYFGSHIYQNTDPMANQQLLERFTGQTNAETELRSKPKREIPSLYDRTPGQTYIYGAPADNTYQRDRYQTSTLKTNITPVPQVRVGPGVTGTYDSKPTDGFHPWYRPQFRNVDELRVNPKNVYGGRMLPGKELVQNRGQVGQVYKRRPDTFFINDPRRWFKTTGAYTGPQIRENFNAHKQNREDSNVSYTGIAGNEGTLGPRPGVFMEGSCVSQGVGSKTGACSPMAGSQALNSQVSHTDKNQLPSVGGYTQVYNANQLKQQKYLYDKARPTIKETTYVQNYMGQAGNESQIKNQKYLYDKARPTIKETTYVKNYMGQAGNESQLKNQKYLYDKARPTIKETTYVQNYMGQAGNESQIKNQKYLYDKARPTIKEGTHVVNYMGQAGNESQIKNQKYLYDKARPTIKEGTHVINYMGQFGNESQIKNQKYLYDKARPTIKEGTHVVNYMGQAGNESQIKQQKYLYDKARPTVKQGTHVINYMGQAGNEGQLKQQKYMYDKARPTIKQGTNVINYMGQAGSEGTVKQQKYLYDKARPTTKETTHVVNYMGTAANREQNLPQSYESIYNATTNNNQEQLLEGRTFGPNKSTNINVGACDINMQIRDRTGYDITKYGPNETKLYTAIPNVGDSYQNTTSQAQRDQPGVRQPEDFVISQFQRNPYTQSLNSAPRTTSPFVRGEIPFVNN
jgi:methylthioribose-1-phosphate isomerase